MAATQRIAAGVVVAAAVAASLAGCSRGAEAPVEAPKKTAPSPRQGAPAAGSAVRLIGDGSTSYTGAQPHLPRPLPPTPVLPAM